MVILQCQKEQFNFGWKSLEPVEQTRVMSTEVVD